MAAVTAGVVVHVLLDFIASLMIITVMQWSVGMVTSTFAQTHIASAEAAWLRTLPDCVAAQLLQKHAAVQRHCAAVVLSVHL
jgi:hypothetical protein